MNFYMYRKLRTALKKGEVATGLVNKDIDYMVSENWLELDMIDSSRFTDYDPIPLPAGTAKITDKGKRAYYKARNKWVFPPFITICVSMIITLLKWLF